VEAARLHHQRHDERHGTGSVLELRHREGRTKSGNHSAIGEPDRPIHGKTSHDARGAIRSAHSDSKSKQKRFARPPPPRRTWPKSTGFPERLANLTYKNAHGAGAARIRNG